MQLYQFEVLKGEEVISAEPAVLLQNTKAAWPKIAKLARSISSPGCRIRVREQSGATIILVGVGVAMRYADFNFGA
jgi:hypothetical protein